MNQKLTNVGWLSTQNTGTGNEKNKDFNCQI